MKTKLVLHNCKNYEVTEENPRNFKIGDIFYFMWEGVTDIQEVTDENILAEVNGTLPDKSDECIDLTFNFWKCVRKVIKH
jgi:hypothetical protein